jgi:hypothetical protein
LGIPAVQNLKILALQPFHKITFGVGDDDADIYAFDVHANALASGSGLFLRRNGYSL